MSPPTVESARILHALPGRVRLRLPRPREAAWGRCEAMLRESPGVHKVLADRRTGNALVLFDPARTGPAALLSALGPGEGPGADRPPPHCPAARSHFALRADDPWAVLAAAAAAGRAAFRVCTGVRTFPPGREVWACALELLGFLQTTPPVRKALVNLLGTRLADLLRQATGLLAELLAREPLALVVAALKVFLGWCPLPAAVH